MDAALEHMAALWDEAPGVPAVQHVLMRLDVPLMLGDETLLPTFTSCLREIVGTTIVTRVGCHIVMLGVADRPGTGQFPIAAYVSLECNDPQRFKDMMRMKISRRVTKTPITVAASVLGSEAGANAFVQTTGRWWIRDAQQYVMEKQAAYNRALWRHLTQGGEKPPKEEFEVWNYMTEGANGPLCPRVCTEAELVNSIREEVVAELAARPDVTYIEEQAHLDLMATVVSDYPAGVDLFAQVDRIERVISDGVLLRLSSFTGRSNVPRELLPKQYVLRLLLSEEDVPPQERGPFVLQRMLLMSFLLTAIGLTERLIQYHPQYDPVLPHTKPRTISLESMQYLAPAVGAATVALGSYNIDFKLLSDVAASTYQRPSYPGGPAAQLNVRPLDMLRCLVAEQRYAGARVTASYPIEEATVLTLGLSLHSVDMTCGMPIVLCWVGSLGSGKSLVQDLLGIILRHTQSEIFAGMAGLKRLPHTGGIVLIMDEIAKVILGEKAPSSALLCHVLALLGGPGLYNPTSNNMAFATHTNTATQGTTPKEPLDDASCELFSRMTLFRVAYHGGRNFSEKPANNKYFDRIRVIVDVARLFMTHMFPVFDGLYDKNIFKSPHTKSLYALLDRHFLLDVAEVEGNIQVNRSSVKLHMMVVYLEVLRYTVMAVAGLSTLEGLGDELARARTFASLMLRISDIFLRCIHRPSIYSVLSVYATQPRVCIPTIYDISGHGEPPSQETIAYEKDLRAAKTSLQELMIRSGMSAVQMCDVFRGLKYNRSVRVIGSSTVLYEFSLARVKDMSQNESVKIEAARISLSTMGEVSETRHTTYSNKEDCVQFTVRVTENRFPLHMYISHRDAATDASCDYPGFVHLDPKVRDGLRGEGLFRRFLSREDMDAIVSHAYPLDVVYDAPWNYAVQRILQYVRNPPRPSPCVDTGMSSMERIDSFGTMFEADANPETNEIIRQEWRRTLDKLMYNSADQDSDIVGLLHQTFMAQQPDAAA